MSEEMIFKDMGYLSKPYSPVFRQTYNQLRKVLGWDIYLKLYL